MAHAHHFLERLDRVSRAQTEFALELYRDHEAVRYVLQHVKLPPEAQRVALAIEDPREGPFVLVTRDGRFVTCLGAGMHHELPVVPRGQIDALLAKVADLRARKELAQRELRPDEEEGDLFQRIVMRGNRFAREDFLALSAFDQLIGAAPYLLTLDMSVEATKQRNMMVHGVGKVVVKGSTRKVFEKLDRFEWSVAHLMVLSCAGERSTLDQILRMASPSAGSPTLSCSQQAGATFFLRAAWAAARLGKAAIPYYKTALADNGDWIVTLDAALGLGAIGLRHAAAMSDVRRILESQPMPPGDIHAPENMAAAARAFTCALVLDAIDHAEERAATTLKIGGEFCVALGQSLPEGHPLRFATTEAVPEELARTAALSFDGDMFDAKLHQFVIGALPVAARASAEDFYHPREVVRAWWGQWEPEETLQRLTRFAKKKTPGVRAEPRPGRNDPCPCGSGKKYKKCHGGPVPVATG